MTDRAPLVLLHGVTMSGRVWRPVIPLVAGHHDVRTPTALGHRGGEPVAERPVRVTHLVDDLERRLDADGLDRVHVAGNSLGGWMAIELARRGRALSATALSPGGFWGEDGRGRGAPVRALRRIALLERLSRPLGPLPHRLGVVRRTALGGVSARGHLVSATTSVQAARDLAGCLVLDDILDTDEAVDPFDPLPCPVTIAWSERDRILPMRDGLPAARRTVPGARFVILPGLGHVPMLDDPAMVADVVLRTTGATG
ncbi:alpha/beta fold hydrolase [Nocardioides marmoribigeumensis]|uniref:Pimeloyl-ACP methyl ester carboxylesterase n=1 Tax=Nocardioides marmoribigeumensis TaxID=433649 RepID=A0ABU2BT12_9ACTN|nr:alpha/beta hydrolase [Nocardioides marmoribigeumensis]MDR7361779.1 pimeloyl-ACP methyl ester carboxylesterase [Nocardioides marmoribigeumensis]